MMVDFARTNGACVLNMSELKVFEAMMHKLSLSGYIFVSCA